jgi:spore coat protein U domain-containing protein, fimbrial subunit CupE1/2/3/6
MNRPRGVTTIFALVLILGSCFWTRPAQAALSCTFTMTTVAFGTVDVTLGTTFSTTGTFSANCSGGSANASIRICISFGAGSGGISGSGAPRFMTNGTNTLSYNLYQDSAQTTVWGPWPSGTGGSGAELDITLNSSGAGSGTKTVYGQVSASQPGVVPASYTSSFSSTYVTTKYGTTSQGTCASNNLPTSTTTPTFSVTATIAATCRVTATALNFGSVGVLGSNVDATSAVTATCTSTTPYNIGFDAGTGSGATVTTRKMTVSTRTVNYSLYTNSGRTTVWGNTVGTNTVSGTGSGAAQALTVYGRVPAQTTPAPGTYADTIVTTITY